MKKSSFSNIYLQDIFSLYLITDLPILQATILTSSFLHKFKIQKQGSDYLSLTAEWNTEK